MMNPTQYARAYRKYVIVRDKSATTYSDNCAGRAIPFAFKSREAAARHAQQRKAFVLCPNGITIL